MSMTAAIAAPPKALRIETVAAPRALAGLRGVGSAVLRLLYQAVARRACTQMIRIVESGDRALLLKTVAVHRARQGRFDSPHARLFAGHHANVVHTEFSADAAPGPARSVWLNAESPSGGVLFYVPGGSFIAHRSPNITAFIQRLAARAGLRAVAIDYRLAPEHPYPAGVEDVVAAFEQLLADGCDPANIVVAAESAGAAVALSALFRLRARGVTPRAIALFSPWTDLALTGWSVVARGLTADSPYAMEMIALSSHFYLQGTASPVDPLASPAYGDLAGLPPILIHTSKTDILHDDAATLARRAADAGVETTLRIWPHGAHVFERYAGPESDRSIAEAARFLRGRLGLSQAA